MPGTTREVLHPASVAGNVSNSRWSVPTLVYSGLDLRPAPAAEYRASPALRVTLEA